MASTAHSKPYKTLPRTLFTYRVVVSNLYFVGMTL